MQPQQVEFQATDGYPLKGHWWSAPDMRRGVVVINAATGVRARYYHYFAAFLAQNGYLALTFDYRGIGLSRPANLRQLRGCDWRCWGERDVEAALTLALSVAGERPVMLVGHSIGGFLPGYAPSIRHVARILTVGAQFAYWRDYAPSQVMKLLLRWHVIMPALTAALGYFPGKRLGWLEDLPAGVANEWSFKGRDYAARLPEADRARVAQGFAAVSAALLAVSVSDDPYGTKPALLRALGAYPNAQKAAVMLEPSDYGFARIGHFDLFHSRHEHGFWSDALNWLHDGINPWPQRRFL
jgi:predicted alpha/beta hydrolase